MASRPSFTPPPQFDEYRIIRALGSGAMGQVYLAQDTLLDRSVAIKFIANLDLEQASASELRERFFIEARAIARLQHPNVVLVYRVGEWQQRPFLVSEFVRGESLDRIQKPLSWQQTHRIGVGLSRGLAAAHRRGVLHRDIKPANAMLTPDGDIKLLDFGLAKLLDTAQPGSPFVSGPISIPPPASLAPTPQPGELKPPRDLQLREVALDATLLPGQRAEESSGPDSGATSSGATSSHLTQYGDVIGSPLYMAPEIWRGEPATRQADIYSLGTLLYELCAGRAPFDGLPIHELPLRVQECDAPPLAEVAPSADPRFCAIVDRCLRRSPASRFDSGEALRAAFEQLDRTSAVISVPQGNPYRGLQSFDSRHRGLFFGRAAETSAIIDRLRGEPLVLIAGNSGVGKSSLCKAGVLPQLEAGALGPLHIATWVPGLKPLTALAQALATALDRDEASVREELATAPDKLGRSLRQSNRQPAAAARHVLVFIDQMEELLTTGDPAEAALIGEALAALLAYSPDVRILGSVRGDFLSRLVALPGLGAEVARGLHLLAPLSLDGLREAITQPALAMGYAFESAALIESLVTATSQNDGGLPLLQFTLAELWEARDPERRIIPAAALHSLGGVGGALARHADQAYERLPPVQQLAARRILGQLVTVEGTRTRKRREELLGVARDKLDAEAALEALVRGRILSVRSDDSGAGSAYELAHEALLTGWGTLRVWLAEDAQLRGLRQRVAQAASEWERLGRLRDLLWQRRQLAEASALPTEMLAARELAFLEASRRTVRLRTLGRALLLAALPLLLILLYVTSSLRTRHALNEKIAEHTAQVRTQLAAARDLNQRTAELRRAALGEFDGRRRDEGERLWIDMLALDEERRQVYRRADPIAEAAFMLNSQRADLRQLVASILFERLILSEQGAHSLLHDDFYQRLVIFDSDGSFRKKLEAPAQLAIHSSPPGAFVTLTPIGSEYQLQPSGARSLGRTPLAGLTIPPGGYLLTFSAPGRIETQLPLVLRRDEVQTLSVPMPANEQVPAGFVYVPPGRFLFGSAAESTQRRDFFYHVPIHERSTDGFLIAQSETTYADWLAFLRSLPAEKRTQLQPRAGQEGTAGWIELRQLPGGSFELTTQPTTQVYRVREGESITYPGRRNRRIQDWLRMPVTAISSDDALAYVSWLDRSGRVPGARLCSELEWERAARGADARLFPHGDHLRPDDANYDETYGQQPLAMGLDEVGQHPGSRSLFGVDDLCGNAFEWVQNSVSDKPFALRGGAYYYGSITDRLDNRQESEPTARNPTVGMRVCATISVAK